MKSRIPTAKHIPTHQSHSLTYVTQYGNGRNEIAEIFFFFFFWKAIYFNSS
jgi:hypothetical protein